MKSMTLTGAIPPQTLQPLGPLPPKADDIRCGPSDEGLCDIADVAAEMRNRVAAHYAKGHDCDPITVYQAVFAIEQWSEKLLRALGKR